MTVPCLADFLLSAKIPCRDCGAPIAFATTTSSKQIPMDLFPSERGNVVLRLQLDASRPEGARLLARVFGKVDAYEARHAGALLYLSHFVTCPAAQARRKEHGK